MRDRTNNSTDTSPSNSEQRKYDHPQWVNKYLALADAALQEKNDEQDQAA
jgi:hypothetical protein